jgi:hypothetical protein
MLLSFHGYGLCLMLCYWVIGCRRFNGVTLFRNAENRLFWDLTSSPWRTEHYNTSRKNLKTCFSELYFYIRRSVATVSV